MYRLMLLFTGNSYQIARLQLARRSFIYGCLLLAYDLHKVIGVPSYILDLCPSIFKSDFKFVDIPLFKVKSLYAFVKKLPFLTLLVEFKIALLFKSTYTVDFIGAPMMSVSMCSSRPQPTVGDKKINVIGTINFLEISHCQLGIWCSCFYCFRFCWSINLRAFFVSTLTLSSEARSASFNAVWKSCFAS